MLSGETAKGAYPLEAVRTMHETCVLAESAICYPPLFNELRDLTPRPTKTTETVASSAVSAAHEQAAGAIIVLTTSGTTARMVSKYRPKCPIICLTRNASTARQVHLHRGCYPFHYTVERGTDWQDDVGMWPTCIFFFILFYFAVLYAFSVYELMSSLAILSTHRCPSQIRNDPRN